MSVLIPVIDHIDGATRRIYLKTGVTEFYPIEDIYHEYRALRRTDEELRKFEPLLKAEGNVPKGGGAFTPRYVVLLDGTKIIPFNESSRLDQLGDMITDDPDVDATLYDISTLTVPKVIFIKPSEAEVIQLNLESIQYSSYQNAVWVSVGSNHSGIDYPSGTREYPVNNITDAVQIASNKGFDTIQVIGQLTLGLGDDVSNLTIKGSNPMTSVLIVQPDAITVNLYVMDIYFTGTLDGGSILRDCVLGAIDYFDGFIEHCAFTSATYKINGVGIFIDCFAGATCLSDPVVDMTDGAGLGVRSFVGNLTITEKHGLSSCQVMINGKLTITDTCDAGSIQAYGDGYVVNELQEPWSTGVGDFILIDKTTGSPDEISDAVWAKVLP